jgi:Rho family, other
VRLGARDFSGKCPGLSGANFDSLLISCSVLLVGDEQTPTTKLLLSYTRAEFLGRNDTYDYQERVWITVGRKSYVLEFNTTGGVEEYGSLLPILCRDASLIIIVTEINRQDTYKKAAQIWIPQITKCCPNTPFIVIGMKDSKANPELAEYSNTPSGLDLVAQSGAARYMECDIGTQRGTKEAFDAAIYTALDRLTRPGHSS